jgi:hypothetical protein
MRVGGWENAKANSASSQLTTWKKSTRNNIESFPETVPNSITNLQALKVVLLLNIKTLQPFVLRSCNFYTCLTCYDVLD